MSSQRRTPPVAEFLGLPSGMLPATLKRTPLYERHRTAGARLVEFAGWEMPLSYRGILQEHRAVRTSVGLFDCSHMGFVELRGGDAGATCQELTTNDVRRLGDGQAQYSLLCNDNGGVLDDVIVYRFGPERYAICLNAANTESDVAWIRAHRHGQTEVVDRSAATALLALQGPRAVDILAQRVAVPIRSLSPFTFLSTAVAGILAVVARTGYTGGDGFELFVAADKAAPLWDLLLEADQGVVPAGLGARDTLRLEAGFLLHGMDMGPTTSALEAGLGWVVKLNSEPFVGRDALAEEARRTPARRMAGLVLRSAGVPRRGYAILHDGRRVGLITSGGMSPILGKGIGLGYVEHPYEEPGTQVAVEIRGRAVPANVVRRPFFRPPAAPAANPDDS